jgi:hypothetical protein
MPEEWRGYWISSLFAGGVPAAFDADCGGRPYNLTRISRSMRTAVSVPL